MIKQGHYQIFLERYFQGLPKIGNIFFNGFSMLTITIKKFYKFSKTEKSLQENKYVPETLRL